jgi:NADH:ubiquinone oxidoreductase subunit K
MILALVLYLIAILGFILNRKNIIHMLLCLELMLLSIALLILVSSRAPMCQYLAHSSSPGVRTGTMFCKGSN